MNTIVFNIAIIVTVLILAVLVSLLFAGNEE